MDLEDDRSSNGSEEEDLILEPVTFKLPTNSKKKNSLDEELEPKISTSKGGSTDNQIRSLYSFYKNILESRKNEVIESKNLKVSTKIYNSLIEQMKATFQINFLTIKVYPNYHRLISDIYDGITEKFSKLKDSIIISVRIEKKFDDLQLLLTHTMQEIENKMPFDVKKKRKETKNIFLFFMTEIEQYNPVLPDYCKYLVEELFNQDKNARLYMVFPHVSAPPNLPDQDFNISKCHLSSPKKMFSKLVLCLIKEYCFFPILSGAMIHNLLKQFDNFELSFQRAVQKVHLITQEYLLSIQEKSNILDIVNVLTNNKQDMTNHVYGKLRRRIVGAINSFIIIEKKVFGQKQNIALKFLEHLGKKDVAYNLPLQMIASLNNFEEIVRMIDLIKQIIEEENVPEFKYTKDELLKLSKMDKNFIPAKAKSKTDKRTEALLQKDKKKEDPYWHSTYLKNELATCLRLFLKNNFVDAYSELEEKLPNLTYKDVDALIEGSQPDILGNIITRLFNFENDKIPRYETSIMLQTLQDFGIKVDISQCFDKFRSMFLAKNPKTDKKIIEAAFMVALNELKYFGLISETRKAKLTIQKNFYGKTFFQEKHQYVEDDDKDDD